MEFPIPRLKGFAFELPLFRYSVNVQDGNKLPVVGAAVNVTAPGFSEAGLTNDAGCYFGSAELYKTYTMKVVKTGFFTWTHQFLLLTIADLSAFGTKNFPVIVRDSSGNPISGASVTINSPKPHTDAGATNTNGLYEGLVEKDYLNDITISAPGFTTYNRDYAPYIKVNCLESNYIAVPVITLNP
jgi:hypothetical protein